MKIRTLSIDIETASDADLKKTGVYPYAENENFRVLLFGYSVNGGPVEVVDLACGESVPSEVLAALTDDSVTKFAYNASFERICLSRYLTDLGLPLCPSGDQDAKYLSPEGWRCTMVWAATLGLPLSLAEAGAALGLDKQKMSEGKDLIRYFCVTGHKPQDAPERWETFKAYNKRDVETEMAIQARLRNFPVPDDVWRQYHIDQEINDRGILLDMQLVRSAIAMDELSKNELTAQLRALTGLENPNSVLQMKSWLSDHGLETDTLGKKAVSKLMNDCPPELREVLRLRGQLAKSSVKKYQAMETAVCSDGRARGMFVFYGANRTGRFSGRLIQLQNLAKNEMPDLTSARALVRAGDYEMTKMLYGDVPDTLSQLVRTAFVAPAGKLFYVADYSAIEARVLAWLAGEQWVLDTFAAGGDIYCATASRMFHVPVVKHGENGHLRQKGKQATLSCGYGGSVGALKAMGALESGMKEEELKPLVDAWREANPHIVQLWRDVENAAITAVSRKTSVETHGLLFEYKAASLFIRLPSGRRLSYARPEIDMNRFGEPALTYMGVGMSKKWERLETFGGKLTENCTQAIARDVLCYAMETLRDYSVVAHIHDELIVEADPSTSLEELCEKMAIVPPWAEGLILRSDGYTTPFYLKD